MTSSWHNPFKKGMTGFICFAISSKSTKNIVSLIYKFYVFEGKEFDGDKQPSYIPAMLPCLGDLKNPFQS